MARQNIINTPQDSGNGDSLFVATTKINEMTLELYAADASFADEIDAINSLINGGVDTLDHKHTIAQINGLQAALNAKVSTSTFNTNILAINASIQAINDALTDITTILNTKVEEAPIDATIYGRKNGGWVAIGSGGTPTGDYVPYTGATKDVNLGANSLSTSANITARNFIINSTPYGELVIGDNNTYQRIAFTSLDTSNTFGSLELLANPEEGFLITKSEISGNYTQINQSNNSILFKNYTSSGDILNTFTFDQTASVFTKVVNVNDGVQTGDVGGANYSQLGTNNGSYAGFYFKSTDSSGDDFGQCSLTINPEEGFVSQFTKTGGFNSNLSHNALGMLAYVGDGIVDNSFNVNTTSTSSTKKVTTQEGFEGNYLQINTGATETSLPGKMYWNDTEGTINFGLKGGQTTVKSGVDLVARIVNKVTPSTTLTKAAYQAVRVSGAQGQRLAVAYAQANNDNNSADTIGLVCETIATNQEGYIMTVGQLEDINTTGSLQGETWTDGDVLYLSPTVAGQLTNVKPIAPGHIVVMGYVEYAHSQHGKIYVKIMNGWELDELHNVSISGATNGQVLTYDSADSLWKNQTLPSATFSGGTVTGSTNFTGGLSATTISATTYSNLPTIASQIGYTPFRWLQVNSTPHTGTTSETIISTATIQGGTFRTSDIMKVFMQTNKPATSNNVTYRFRLNTSNTLVGATQIALFTTTTSQSYAQIQRTFTLRDDLLYGYAFNQGAVNDFANTGGALQSTAFDTSNTFYIFFTVQLGNINDTATISLTTVTN